MTSSECKQQKPITFQNLTGRHMGGALLQREGPAQSLLGWLLGVDRTEGVGALA